MSRELIKMLLILFITFFNVSVGLIVLVVKGGLMDMPSKYKIVVYMCYYEGYSTVEIAKILDKNESTIRSHLSTGGKRLKIEMEGDSK